MNNRRLLAGTVVYLLATSALAGEKGNNETAFALGAFVGSEQSLYVGGEDETEIRPLISAEWGRYFLRGPSVGMHLYRDRHWGFSASVGMANVEDTDRGDSAQLADMGDLDDVFAGRLGIEYENDWGTVEAGFGADISGSHDGYTAELAYSHPFEAGGWRIEPGIGVEWLSEEVTDYYYGVSAAHARAGRAAYQADSAVNYSLELSTTYPFRKNHAFQVRAAYKRFGDEITDSPIVDRDDVTEFGVGYIYRF